MAKTLTVKVTSVNVRSAPSEGAAFVNNANGVGYRKIVGGEQYPVLGEFFFDGAGRELVANSLPADYWHWAQIKFMDSISTSNFVCVRKYRQVPPFCIVQDDKPTPHLPDHPFPDETRAMVMRALAELRLQIHEDAEEQQAQIDDILAVMGR